MRVRRIARIDAVVTNVRRRFLEADQGWFAALSGDCNPIHMDAVAARRTPAGAPVVHGMHAVLWALDWIASTGLMRHSLATLEARFLKFIYVGSEATLTLRRVSEDSLDAEICADGLVAIVLKLGFGNVSTIGGAPRDAQLLDVPAQPLAPDVAELAGSRGILASAGGEKYAEAFPDAARSFGVAQVEELARLSTLVGMVCPGLQSIFSSAKVTFGAATGRSGGLGFQVESVDERFRLVALAVTGSGLFGDITAFSRPASVSQARFSAFEARVVSGEFAATTALIIGGSRGLGAVSARLIAAGGGRVVATFLQGEVEAQELRHEIGAESCHVLRYDAREEPLGQLGILPWKVTQLYYFATTHIFRQKALLFEAARFSEFCKIYVEGFAAACTALRALGVTELTAFYPSSVAVQENTRQLTEYRMAKIAGELLCADLNAYERGTHILVKRLPRILTDQTATVIPVESADALDVMLPIIREMHA